MIVISHRINMIRQQAAIDLTHKPEDGTYITEQQIDDYLIANHKDDEDDSSIIAAQQKYQTTLGMVRASNSRHGLYRDATRLPPNPAPVSTVPEGHDWDFFYRSLLAAPETKSALLTTMSSSKKPVLKSELRTQRATTLSERISKSNMQCKPPYGSNATSMQSSTPEPR